MPVAGKFLHLTPEKTFIKERKREDEREKEEEKFLGTISFATELGFLVVVPLLGGAFFGQFLDRNFGTTPKLTLSLIFFGLMISFFNIYNLIKEK